MTVLLDIPADESFRRKRECDAFEADHSNVEIVVDAYRAEAAGRYHIGFTGIREAGRLRADRIRPARAWTHR